VLLEADAVPVIERVYADGYRKGCKGEGEECGNVHDGWLIGSNYVFVCTKTVVMMRLIERCSRFLYMISNLTLSTIFSQNNYLTRASNLEFYF
jgi:hypothetical protein